MRQPGGLLPTDIAFELVDGGGSNNTLGYVVWQADQDYWVLSASAACDSDWGLKAFVGKIRGYGGTLNSKMYVTGTNTKASGSILKGTIGFSAIVEPYIQDAQDPDLLDLIGPSVGLNRDYVDPMSWREVLSGEQLLMAMYDFNSSGSTTRYGQCGVNAVPKEPGGYSPRQVA